MNKLLVLVLVILAVLTAGTFAKTKHQKMFEDLYLKSEDELFAEDFIGMYALLVHRNIIAEFIIPGPHQEETWGDKAPFIIRNPQLVNLALALGKTKLARVIIAEVEKRRPRGFDDYPEYAGQQFPLPEQGEDDYPEEMMGYLPERWIEHQFVGLTVIPPDGSKARSYQDTPPMCICVLNQLDDCFDALVESKYKPTITSNRTYVMEPVLLAATLNVWQVLPKLVDLGAPLDMQDRSHILTSTSPYLMGCTRGHVEWVQAMLRMGYDIDEQHGKDGDTCLHGAAQGGHFALVKFLIEKGADLTIINAQDGQSAYSLSVQHHQRHVQALLAEGLLKQRLPLPPPPTLRQRLNDIERQDDIHQYLLGYMSRTGKTKEDVMEEFDVVAYDPYYDFNGSYDPQKVLGNINRDLAPDRIAKSGAATFLIELDGIIYTAGTHTFEAKMQEYLQKEKDGYKQKDVEAGREHEALMQMVNESMALAIEQERKDLEEKKAVPKEVREKTNQPNVDPDATIPDFEATQVFSSRIVQKKKERDAKKKVEGEGEKKGHDEL